MSAVKTTIIVRSIVVMRDNLTANLLQLHMNGMSLPEIGKKMISKFLEITEYVKNKNTITTLERQYTSAIAKQNQTEAKKLRAKIAALEDANASMSIAPLIKAGEFNTISESLTEADVAIRDSKFGEWLETAVDKLPSGIGGVAKNLLMTKDSAAFKGLNRMVQYGDFVAKAALFEHLTETGMEERDALDRILEEFVQYNRLPGTRALPLRAAIALLRSV